MVGNIPNFNKIDVLRCFLKLESKKSRQELAKELGLGEGTIRTILDILKAKKLTQSDKKGHYLSSKGSSLLKEISSRVSSPKIISADIVYPNLKKAGAVIRDVGRIDKIYRFRDIAVKNGAEGALILRFDGRLFAPESGYRQDFKEFENHFELQNNDIVVIAFSEDRRSAENGVLAIAVEISSGLKKFINAV